MAAASLACLTALDSGCISLMLEACWLSSSYQGCMSGSTVLCMLLTVLPGTVLPALHCLVLTVPCNFSEQPDHLHCQGKLPCYNKLYA